MWRVFLINPPRQTNKEAGWLVQPAVWHVRRPFQHQVIERVRLFVCWVVYTGMCVFNHYYITCSRNSELERLPRDLMQICNLDKPVISFTIITFDSTGPLMFGKVSSLLGFLVE